MVTEVVFDPWVLVSMFLGMFVFFQQLTFAREAENRRADYINPDRRQRLVLEAYSKKPAAHSNKGEKIEEGTGGQRMDIEELAGEEVNPANKRTGTGSLSQARQQKNPSGDFNRTETGFKRLSSANFIGNPGFGSGIYNSRHPQTPSFGGNLQPVPVVSHTPIHQNISTNFNHFSPSGLPVGLGSSGLNSYHNQGFLSTAQNHSAYVNPLQQGQGMSAPPLFVGFLTNDVSMNQIRNLFTSYTKAVNDTKQEGRATGAKGKDRVVSGKRAPGRFDVTEALSEEEDDDAEEVESTKPLGKRNVEAKLAKEAKISHQIGKTLDLDALKKDGIKLKPEPVPIPVGKKSPEKPSSLFSNKPTGITSAVERKPSGAAEPTKPTLAPAPTKPETPSSTLFNSMAPTQTAPKDEPKANKPEATAAAPSKPSGLFGNVLGSLTTAPAEKPATSGTGVFAAVSDSQEPVKRKTTLFDNGPSDSQQTKSGLFGAEPAKEKESFLTVKPVEPAAKEEAKPASGLFAGIAGIGAIKPTEGKTISDSTVTATSFVNKGPGSLFDTAQGVLAHNSTNDLLNTSFAAEPTPKPNTGGSESGGNSGSILGSQKPATTAYFKNEGEIPKQDASINPFLTATPSNGVNPATKLQNLIQSSPSSAFQKESAPVPQTTSSFFDSKPSAGGIFSTGGQATGSSTFFSGTAAGIFGQTPPAQSAPVAPAPAAGLFGSLIPNNAVSATGLFGNAPSTPATSSLFGNTSGSTGLFGPK